MLRLIFLLGILLKCQAVHFEGGSITYKVINTTNSTVSIMINQSSKLNMAVRDENGKYLNCTTYQVGMFQYFLISVLYRLFINNEYYDWGTF